MKRMIIVKSILRLLGMALLLMVLRSNTFGQTYVLPDTNFRNVLLAKYPSVMTGDKLNIAAANTFVFDLIIPNANISDLTGVQYFTSIYKLDATVNKITTIPDLSNLKNLAYLYLSNNSLTNVNFLIHCTKLLQIHLFDNQLTAFPELPGFTRLQHLFLSGNRIESLSGLSNFTDLRVLFIGSNRLNTLPDLSKNTKLEQLHCNSNNISDIEIIKELSNLKIVSCYGNKLTDLSVLDSNTVLEELYASNNLLTSLPVLVNKPALNKLLVSNNKLTFEDLLPLTNLMIADFEYAPQDSVGEEINYSIRRLDDITLTPQADAGVNTNMYSWYKSNTLLSNTLRNLNVKKAQLSDAGAYHVEITNSALPLLTLIHRNMKISVNSNCMDVVSYGYKIVSQECKEGTEIKLILSLSGAEFPLTYSLNNFGQLDSIVNTSEIIPAISPGIYSLTVTDQRECRIVVDPDLTVYRPADCEAVIAPLSNGPQASYFIESAGVARILDMNGVVIRELNAPAVWDGNKADGSAAEFGYYVITVDDKKLTNITVIR